MRLILLGHCSYYTISNFACAIKQYLGNYSVTVADPVKPGGDELTDEDKNSFDEIINLPSKRNIKLTRSDKYESLKDILQNKKKIKYFLKCLLLLRMNSLKNFINGNAENNIFEVLVSRLLENYDIYHFHYVTPEFLWPIKFIKKDKKVILTFWGSDLFQVSGTENYSKQLEAFYRADIITVNSLEMKEIFLAKFGRNFEPVVRIADFGLNEKKLGRLNEKNNQKTIADYKRKNNVGEDKIIIVVGYSGSSKQKQIEILKILNGLDHSIRRKIFAIIPMTYGLQFEDRDYLQKVKNECNRAGFETKVISEFMPEEELLEFIISGQIKLNLRDTDAMNAAMLESLFAGNIVVSGSWLPYGKLRRLGIYYEEIETLDELTKLIPRLIENIEQEKNKTINNTSLVYENFSNPNTILDWIKIYNDSTDNQNRFKNVS